MFFIGRQSNSKNKLGRYIEILGRPIEFIETTN